MNGDAAADRKALLADFLVAGSKIAQRLSWSIGRLGRIMPLDEDTIARLSEEDEESLDAFLHRFTSLVSMLQDNLGRSILVIEEEDLSTKFNGMRAFAAERHFGGKSGVEPVEMPQGGGRRSTSID